MRDPLPAAAIFPANPVTASAAEKPQLKCPRCDSTNTKFCYYNNYNLSQPRHFCKNCRRYWTKGGALRNIPVGGGTRKNSKRSSNSNDSSNPKRPTTDPSPVLKPEPVPALCPPPVEAADNKMLEITGSFSSLLQSTGQFENLNFLDTFDSPCGGGGCGSGVVWGSDSGEPSRSGDNPNPDPPSQQPVAENFLGWVGGWPDLAIYTSPGSSFQ